MTETPLDAQKRIEALRQYDQLTARIAALDTDIGRSIDSEHRLTAQQARTDLARQRDIVAADLSALGWDGNNQAQMRAKINDLLSALDNNQPERAHQIIGDIVTIESRMTAAERTLGQHEARLGTIERKQNPPWQVTLLRVAASVAVILAIIVGVWKFQVFIQYPEVGIIVEGALLSLALVTAFYANSRLEERVT